MASQELVNDIADRIRSARRRLYQAWIHEMFAAASRTFAVPVWFATVPHCQVFEGEWVGKMFKSRADFDYLVTPRQRVNDVTRRVAIKEGVPLFDIEADLVHRTDLCSAMFHFNPVVDEAV